MSINLIALDAREDLLATLGPVSLVEASVPGKRAGRGSKTGSGVGRGSMTGFGSDEEEVDEEYVDDEDVDDVDVPSAFSRLPPGGDGGGDTAKLTLRRWPTDCFSPCSMPASSAAEGSPVELAATVCGSPSCMCISEGPAKSGHTMGAFICA